MNLLGFNLPPFARINYVSKEVKEEWEPKVKRAERAYETLEKLTVSQGLRDASTFHVDPHDMDRVQVNFLKQGLVFVPLKKIKKYTGFSHRHEYPKQGEPYTYYGVVVREASAAHRWAVAENSQPMDNKTLGELLGYPSCCTEAFQKNWVEDRYIDPIWQIADNTKGKFVFNGDQNKIRFSPKTMPWQTNIMLRYIGIRILPHMPCSFDCEHSIKMANDWMELGRANGVEGIEDIKDLLDMNISWDALKGIGIISTPIMKLSVNTVACYPSYVVEREGDYYPDNVPTGVKFPWKIPAKMNKIEELRRLQAEGKVSIFK